MIFIKKFRKIFRTFVRKNFIKNTMIFYFSGTGNSKHVAEKLGGYLDTPVKNIADYYNEVTTLKNFSLDLDSEDFLGFVSPVHSWGLALPVARFLKKTKINYSGKKVFAVFVCGDTCGKAREQLQEKLKKKSGISCNFVCSVQMPNTYIVMKGFGTDSDELAGKKLETAEKELPEIAKAIKTGGNFDRYVVGTHPFLKGRIIYPLFMKFTLGDKKFFADENCTDCGKCEKVCPEKNISLVQGRPQWKGHCVKCLACIHRCPSRAVQYGDITRNMGRYCFKPL